MLCLSLPLIFILIGRFKGAVQSREGLLGADDENGEERRMQVAAASLLHNACGRTDLSHLVALEISAFLLEFFFF